MTTGRFFCLLLAGLCMAAVGYGVSYWYPLPRSGQSSEPVPAEASSPSPLRIEAQGRLEPVSGTITVAALPGEEIAQLNTHVGQTVKKDDILAVLGSQKLRQQERALADEQLKKAQRQLEAERKLGELREELAALSEAQADAKAKEIPPLETIDIAKRRKELAAEQLTILQQLKENPQTSEAISAAEIKQQELLITQLQVELDFNQSKRDAANEAHGLAKQAAELDANMLKVTQNSLDELSPLPVLEQGVKLTQLAEEASVVKAPCDGTVLELYARQGERVATTPILQMGDLRQMVCIAEVHEANLKELKVLPPSDKPENGKLVPARDYPVTMRSSAIEKDLHGKVIEVGRLIGAPSLRDPNPLAQSDRRTVNVRIELDEASTEIARRFVNLQVDVSIQLSESK